MHFVGILGSGTLPLAVLLYKRGYFVSGTDRQASLNLLDYGFSVTDHTVYPPTPPDLVVYSLAVEDTNPQIMYANGLSVPLISRAQLLGALMSDYGTRISVSGSHGKSTVTALIDAILIRAGRSVTTVSGATLCDGLSVREGQGDVFLAEACEYKDSFLRLCPTHQLISGVELDHTDYFCDIEAIRRSFLLAARRAATVVINTDDAVADSIARELYAEGYTGQIVTYGRSYTADYVLSDVRRAGDETLFTILTPKENLCLKTRLIGDFNLMNITAAVALADTLGTDANSIREATAVFSGIERRQSVICRIGGTPVYYDYAHHPTEIGAVITALREKYKTVTVVFRPHTFSRTQSLWNEFIVELSKADFTILLEIYPAREKYIDGITSDNLAKAMGHGALSVDVSAAAELAVRQGNGAILLIGAGDVESVKEDFIKLGKTRI